MARITAVVGDTTHKSLKLLSVLEGRSLNDLVQDALTEYLKGKKEIISKFLPLDDKCSPAILIFMSSSMHRVVSASLLSLSFAVPTGAIGYKFLGHGEALRGSRAMYATPVYAMRRLSNAPYYSPSKTFDPIFRDI